MKELNLSGCREVTGKTGGSTTNLLLFILRPDAHAYSFLTLPFFLCFFLSPSSMPIPSTGNIAHLNLPEGMESVNFCSCKGLTGTAEFRDE